MPATLLKRDSSTDGAMNVALVHLPKNTIVALKIAIDRQSCISSGFQ